MWEAGITLPNKWTTCDSWITEMQAASRGWKMMSQRFSPRVARATDISFTNVAR